MGAFDGLRAGQVDHGYWGKHTSSIDWCEDNYAQSPYIAEFINTLTNIPGIFIGIWAAFTTVAGGVNKRYALMYLGLSFIGIGSFGFHASLKWEWQLMDELPMIYVVSYAAYLVLDTLPSFKPRFGLWGPLILVSWCIFVTLSYLYLPNPIYHQIAFAIILLSCTSRNIILIRRLPAGHPSRKLIGKTLAWGIATFAGGFGIWNIDNVYCNELRRARNYLGPWGFVLEGHAIWHLMTSYGSFLIFAAAIYLQLSIKVSPDAYTFDGSSWFPVVRATMTKHAKVTKKLDADKKSEKTGEANGHANGNGVAKK